MLQVLSLVVVLAHAQADDAGNQDAGNQDAGNQDGMKNMMKKLVDHVKQAGTKLSGKGIL